ncbi:Panacea domain-containing protein [Gimesia panareensis]|uniref:Panacea domain-containing protein n=1 Tax=Gimesia panareensis TaxID=2527978 RepID=UPI0011896936|nr:type II toxin-antitoxin system antitoxin SocA domain-containing protein [Gimesia panareensis]QDU52909.1 hypothetical protein Pan110_52910 [Gimesia panareensis]
MGKAISHASTSSVVLDIASGTGYTSSDNTATADITEKRVRASMKLELRLKEITANVFAILLVQFCNKHGDLITNLKLQKLLYYSQAWYLALYDSPLFPDKIEAWPNGPVQPEVFENFSRFGHGPIELEPLELKVPKKITTHVEEVMRAYGHLSAFDLESLSCEEEPWKASWNKSVDGSTPEIPKSLMQKFYKLRLDD